MVTDFGFQSQRTTQEGQSPSSASAFQVNTWNSYAAGWIPDTIFFYFSEFDIVTAGSTSPNLMNAYFGYSGGTAKNSWYLAGGREHIQVGEGTRAAQIYSLMPDSPLMFETMSPTNFLLDQSPVGIDAGYTWASEGYKQVFSATAKVTNGDNADGGEILGLSTKNSEDVWFDVDWWYAPESGVTFLDYYGTKDQVQNSGLTNQFTYHPAIRRQGIFANYMFNYKVDMLGGYLRTKDDWQVTSGLPGGYFSANDFFGEVDYYIDPGLAVAGRYDFLSQRLTGSVGGQTTHDWAGAVNKNLTRSGNIVGRMGYSYMTGRDPSTAVKSTSRKMQLDIMFNF